MVISSRAGTADMPSVVRRYSTHGGDSDLTSRTTRPSASSSFSVMLSMRAEMWRSTFWMSLKRMLPCE